ncbi:DUF459 domain-containing protein [Brasilonema sp. UFV-L1]|uniref:DUF459 domain-containing protein n=1 Tax=Brasilonema sp. UFV-L1 TaxID=2234130 RepID=UPI00145E8723|nr:DUF459 domain-containing protein [Brasilonema sp. UFV-L1]NMG07540.1 DUF459 domain-containing protein [Brasilonema sp. UFV-L1]
MKDKRFFLISSSVSLLLIVANFPLFIKSLGSSQIAIPRMKQAAQQVKIEGVRKHEQEFWNSIKEIDFDPIKKKSDIPQVQPTLSQIYKPQQTPLEVSQKKPEKPYTRFLLLGDSIIYALSVEFENAMKKSSYKYDTLKVEYKISTGLNRIDFYNWYLKTPQVINKYKPDIMIVVFGGNDDQDILDTKNIYRAELTPAWEKAYQERVERYAKLLEKSSVRKVYWIGHPISNLARYNKFFPIFNKIYQKVADASAKIEYVDCWDIFAVNGKFAPVVANKSGKKGQVRTSDGVHFTLHGANILVNRLMEKMVKDKVLQPKPKSEK